MRIPTNLPTRRGWYAATRVLGRCGRYRFERDSPFAAVPRGLAQPPDTSLCRPRRHNARPCCQTGRRRATKQSRKVTAKNRWCGKRKQTDTVRVVQHSRSAAHDN